MKTLATLSLGALLAMLAASPGALAHPGPCEIGLRAMGRMANGLNFDPPRHYDTIKAARSRAIAAWRQKVAARCPGHSTFWWRAHAKRIDCEGYAGGVSCEVEARPARKLFSLLYSP
jgi:hypothetical protein